MKKCSLVVVFGVVSFGAYADTSPSDFAWNHHPGMTNIGFGIDSIPGATDLFDTLQTQDALTVEACLSGEGDNVVAAMSKYKICLDITFSNSSPIDGELVQVLATPRSISSTYKRGAEEVWGEGTVDSESSQLIFTWEYRVYGDTCYYYAIDDYQGMLSHEEATELCFGENPMGYQGNGYEIQYIGAIKQYEFEFVYSSPKTDIEILREELLSKVSANATTNSEQAKKIRENYLKTKSNSSLFTEAIRKQAITDDNQNAAFKRGDQKIKSDAKVYADAAAAREAKKVRNEYLKIITKLEARIAALEEKI